MNDDVTKRRKGEDTGNMMEAYTGRMQSVGL